MVRRWIESIWRRMREGWNDTWALAVVFGLASMPWTYAFVAELHLPLWPSFIASATFFAAGGSVEGLKRGYASNFTGIVYAAATIWIVEAFFGGGVVTLSVVVGVFMFLASLHDYIPLLSFTPGGFFGYATMFGVHAAAATGFGLSGLSGETLTAIASMFIGAAIGLTTERISHALE